MIEDPKKKHWVFNEVGPAASKQLEGRSVKDLILSAAKKGNVDPSLLYGSSLVEGFNVVASKGNRQSPAYENAAAGYSEFVDEDTNKVLKARTSQNKLDTKNFPIDGFKDYGLDTFGDNYESLKKYLPTGFDKRFQVYEGYNDATKADPSDPTGKKRIANPQKIRTAAFKTNEDALVAKSAFLNLEKDRVGEYLNTKGLNNLDQRTKDYFTLAAYNGGYGNAKKIVDEYAGSKDRAHFIDSGATKFTSIHNNIYPRIAVQGEAKKALGLMAKGGKIPKYAEGDEIDPITGKPKQQFLDQPKNLGVDVFAGALNAEVPINPNAPANEQIFKVQDQKGTNTGDPGIIPLSQYFDISTDKFGNKTMQGNGKYVNELGQSTTPEEQQAIADQISQDNLATSNKKQTNKENIEFAASAGISAINNFFNKRETAQTQRTDRRKAIMDTIEGQKLNPYLEGTGSQAIYEKGGKLASGGGLSRSDDYGSKKKPYPSVKSGDFAGGGRSYPIPTRADAVDALRLAGLHGRSDVKAKVYAKYPDLKKAEGGEVEGLDHAFDLTGGGKANQISDSDHSNPMVEFIGNKHKDGGIGINYGGTAAEVEHKEVGWVDGEGSLNIFGKLKLPGTNQTFKKVAKDIAEEEDKIDKTKQKYTNILVNSDPYNKYQETANATAKVMFKSLDKQSKQIAEKKEALSSYQNLILAMTDPNEPGEHAYGGKLPKKPKYMALGDELDPDSIKRLKEAIGQYESSGKYDARGPVVTKGKYKGERALGKYQVMPGNLKAWSKEALGREVTEKEFLSNPDIQDQIVEHRLTQISAEHPDPKDIASVWFSGRPLKGNTSSDVNVSTPEYVKNVIGIFEKDPQNKFKYGNTEFSRGDAKKLYDFAKMDSEHPLNSKDAGDFKRLEEYLGYNQPKEKQDRIAAKTPGVEGDTDFVPRIEKIDGAGGTPVETPYGQAARPATPFRDQVNIGNGNRTRGYISPLAVEQIAPELLTLGTNRREAVPQLTYQPELKQTFDISYQLGRNENQSTFNQASKVAEQIGSVEALSQLAAQKYKADEAYNMQEIQGNAQQKLGVYSQNVDTLNDAKLKNLALIADQENKIAQAKFNTRKEDLGAFTSIAAKVQQNKLENKTYNAYANLFKHYGFDKKGNVTFEPDSVVQKFSPGEAEQFGFAAAQQGAKALGSGDFSRQFTKVKNEDGSTTTTETLGRNKLIQEKYKALKNQGFDDGIIGNMLLAEFPETINKD